MIHNCIHLSTYLICSWAQLNTTDQEEETWEEIQSDEDLTTITPVEISAKSIESPVAFPDFADLTLTALDFLSPTETPSSSQQPEKRNDQINFQVEI